MNHFSGIGRIGKDAVVRRTQTDKAVTGWSLAINKGFGERKETIWLDCTWWGERGEKVAEYIRKGDRLGVVGEIGTREHDGKIFVTLDVRDVTLLGDKRDAEPRQDKPQRGGPVRPAPATDDFEDDLPFLTNRGTY